MLRAVPKPNFKRRIPTQFERNRFSKATRHDIMLRDDGYCRVCKRIATQIHHVKLSSQGGRGVFTNGMCTCHACHIEIHRDNEKIKFWQRVFEREYGSDYFKDCWDE